MRRRAIRAAVVLAAAVAIAIFVLRALENRFLYFPDRTLVGSPADAGLDHADVALRTADGVRLHAWHVRVEDPRAIVVHFHGNAGNLSHRVPYAQHFAAQRLDTLLVDYRGYGRSEGAPSEAGLFADADAALAWARGRDLPIVVYGESLGGAVAIDLASRERVAALVVQSSFTRLAEMADRILPFGGALVSQKFDSLAKIRRVQAPVLVVHGDLDEVVPFEMGVRLHAAVRASKSFFEIPGAHHNDVVERAGAEIARRLQALID